jgi:DMSO reductase anchor subunit
MSGSKTHIQLSRLLWVGPLTVIASILGVLIVRVIAVAVLQPDPAPMSLGWALPTFFTFVLVTGAVLVFALVARFAKDPIRTYQVIAFVFLLVSFLPDIAFARSPMPGANWPDAFALMVMHVVAWGICVTLLGRLSTVNSEVIAS